MKSKLIIALTVFILMVTISLLIGLHNSAKMEVVRKFQSQQLFTARQLSRELELCLRDECRTVETLSSLPVLKNKKTDSAAEAIQKYFEYLKKNQVKSISIYDEKGTIIYSTLKEAISIKLDDSKFFTWSVQRENKGKQLITSEVPAAFSKSNMNSAFQVMIVAPIYSGLTPEASSLKNLPYKESSDQFVGIISAVVSLDGILTSFFQQDSSHFSKENAWLIDKDGTVLYQAEHPEMIMFNMHQQNKSCFECHDSFKYVETIQTNNTGSTEYQLKGNPQKLSSFVTLNFKNISWKVVTNTPLDEVTSFVDKNSTRTLALIIVISLILIGSSFFISRSNRLKLKAEAETEKLRGQQAFNLILECAGEGIFGLDLNGNHTFVNPMAATLLGYTRDELIGKHSHTLWHHTRPNGEPYLGKECHIYETLHEGISYSGEEYFWRKDCAGFPVDYSTTPILDAGKVVGAVVTFQNITERKLAEEALKASEERFRSVTQTANDAIIISNKVGTILGWNRGAERIFGYEETEIIGKSFELIVPLDNREKRTAGIEPFVAENEHRILGKTMELQGLHKSGNFIPVELSLSEWKTSNEIFYTGIIRDISERKKAEAETEAEQEKQREILEKLNNLSGLLADDTPLEQSLGKGLQIILSTSFLALKQMGAVFLVNSNSKELVLKCNINLPSALQTICNIVPYGRCLCGRAAITREIQYANCIDDRHENQYSGIEPHGHYSIPIISDDELFGVIVVYLHDRHPYNSLEVSFLRSTADIFSAIITRKRAENEIKSKNEQLQKTNSEKDKFFSIIAHDLRSPFNGFLGLTQIMEEDLPTLTMPEIQEIAVSLRSSANNLFRLLENLLEWAKMQQGLIHFDPKVLQLLPSVDECVTVMFELAKNKGIEITYHISNDLKVFTDSNILQTVIRNLVSNAVKFTPSGGNVCLSAKDTGNKSVEISIRDTGIGMSPKMIENLFRLDVQTSREGTDGEPSSGLGLLLCKEFVEKNAGKIWVESEEGVGSTFYFTLSSSNT